MTINLALTYLELIITTAGPALHTIVVIPKREKTEASSSKSCVSV